MDEPGVRCSSDCDLRWKVVMKNAISAIVVPGVAVFYVVTEPDLEAAKKDCAR